MVWVYKIHPYLPFIPFGAAVLPYPGASLNFLGPVVLVAADHAIVDDDQAPTASEESLKLNPLFALYFHTIRGKHNQDIGVFELFGCREIHRSLDFDAPFPEQGCVVTEEPRVVMLTGAVGFDAGSYKHSERAFRRVEQSTAEA